MILRQRSVSIRRGRTGPVFLILSVFFLGSLLETGTFTSRRRRMMEEQIRSRGVKSRTVISAMLKIERHLFVPENLRAKAYEDYPLPIGMDQTISQPYIVALMTELLDLSKEDRVLEIGTGSGYQAAVLAELAGEVYTMEIIPELAGTARELLERVGLGRKAGRTPLELSGGERQRVAIARAILKNAPIIVLDEATSSLDSESEELIQQALAKLMKNKTVIVIAHRLSTIMKMDRIIVLENGKIVEEGSHESLVKKKNGLYCRLWTKQVGGFIG